MVIHNYQEFQIKIIFLITKILKNSGMLYEIESGCTKKFNCL